MSLAGSFLVVPAFADQCIERFIDCEAIPQDSGFSFVDGILALLAVIAVVGVYKGLAKATNMATGWHKLIPFGLVPGLFVVNYLSKQVGSERPIHIAILAGYLIISFVLCFWVARHGSTN